MPVPNSLNVEKKRVFETGFYPILITLAYGEIVERSFYSD
jgi:hypothetical protein